MIPLDSWNNSLVLSSMLEGLDWEGEEDCIVMGLAAT